MADTIKETNELRIKCTLRRGTEQTTRTIAVNNPKTYDETERQRMIDFRDKLMTGSLSGVIQPASWRDDDPNIEPFETAAVEFATFRSTEVTHDLDEEYDPDITLTWSPATLTDEQVESFVNGTTAMTLTATAQGETNFELYAGTPVEVYGTTAEDSVTIGNDGNGQFTFTINHEGAPTPLSMMDGQQSVLIKAEVLNASSGAHKLATFNVKKWQPRAQITNIN